MNLLSSATLARPATAVLGRLRHAVRAGRGRPRRHPFDLLHGVDTSGLMYADSLVTGHAHDCHNEGYYASAPSLFHGAVGCWQQTLSPLGPLPGEYHFIDLGCGKGRALMLATEYRFQSVKGIELNAKLVRIARGNLRRWIRRPQLCNRVSVERGDALTLTLPHGPVLLFVFNSFQAEVVRGLVEWLVVAARTRTAPIDLIYLHPDHDAMIARTPGIELLRYSEIAFSEEDAKADVFGVSSDLCSIYRLAGSRMDC